MKLTPQSSKSSRKPETKTHAPHSPQLGSCPEGYNPELFGKLEAADCEAEDVKQTSGNQSNRPWQALFALERLNQIKLQGPKKVEAIHHEGFICVGGFSNPLF
jgi:hypothetical protein